MTNNDLGMSAHDGVAPHELLNHGPSAQVPFSELHPHPELDPLTWLPIDSSPSSAYSGSPPPSESSLPVHAPKPQHASAPFWPASDVGIHPVQGQMQEYPHQHGDYAQTYEHAYEQHGGDMSIGMDFTQSHQQPCGSEMDMHHGMQHYGPSLDTLFEPSYVGGDVAGHISAVDYQYNDMVHEFQ
jgi:transcription factor SOX7/8/10/18 (SOX group E/F)